jgi:hypothetical protein
LGSLNKEWFTMSEVSIFFLSRFQKTIRG